MRNVILGMSLTVSLLSVLGVIDTPLWLDIAIFTIVATMLITYRRDAA